MTKSTRYFIGIFCVILYIIIASLQSVMLNIWLHSVNIFLLVSLSFIIVSLIFFILGLIYNKESYILIYKHWKLILILNIVSFTNWILYFFSVKYVEPSIAVTFTQGITSVSMTIYYLFKKMYVSYVTKICNFLILLTSIFLCFYTLEFRTKFSLYSKEEVFFGIIIAILCSISIAFTILISKKFVSNNIPNFVLLSVRFPLLIIICLTLLSFEDNISLTTNTLYIIVFTSFIGLASSLYFFQKGVELSPSITVSTSLALSPIVVFSIQATNSQIPLSGVVFLFILFIVILSIISIIYDQKYHKS